ncbi:MAG: hypothetical protein LJE97_02395 [Betaproteobacteria bacterium]|nr:hypothetical protein [Betaproteobacteria bacterium]
MNGDEPRDPNLDAAYRATAREEPPRALDERILAAAHRAVDAHPVPAGRSFAQRWRVPVAVAATVVLSATVTLMVYESEQAPTMLEELSPGKVREDHVVPGAARRGDLDKESGGREAKPSELQERRSVVPPSAAPPPATPADERGLRQMPAQKPERAQSNEAKRAPAPFPAEPARPATPPVAEPPRAKDGLSPLRKKSESAGAASPPASETESASSMARERALGDRPTGRTERDAATGVGQPALRSPEDWIAEIRRLKKAGQTEEANRLLAEFRDRFPDHPLPDDLP